MRLPTRGGDLVLRTERLELRPFEPSDAQAVFDVYASKPDVTKYMAFPTHRSVAEAVEFVDTAALRLARGEAIVWAIRFQTGPALVGGIGLEYRGPEWETGFIIGREYWGQGIVPEALRAVLAFSRDVLELSRLQGRCDVENPKSARVFEKCGFRRTGMTRKAGIHPNAGAGLRDVYTFEYDFA